MKHKAVKLRRLGTTEPVTAYLLHYKVVEDKGGYFETYYEKKRPTPSHRRDVTAVYWIPSRPLRLSMEEKADLSRGKHFFRRNDGFLFGALVALRNTGELFHRRLV